VGWSQAKWKFAVIAAGPVLNTAMRPVPLTT
jgi:hypothetical protein